jgi:hypothetical protein
MHYAKNHLSTYVIRNIICVMRTTDGTRISNLIYEIVGMDKVTFGTAKARFAGEAKYSVPTLERLMRGQTTSEENQKNTLTAARAWKFPVKLEELFPLVTAKGKAS